MEKVKTRKSYDNIRGLVFIRNCRWLYIIFWWAIKIRKLEIESFIKTKQNDK